MATDFGFKLPKETLQKALAEIEQRERDGGTFVLEVSACLIPDGIGYEVAHLDILVVDDHSSDEVAAEHTVILTRGLPASGKTTWAKEMMASHPGTYKRINKDDLRQMLDAGFYSEEAEKLVREARDVLMLLALRRNYDVINDDTNLNPLHAQRIRGLVQGMAEVVVQDFTEVDVETCVERDSNRHVWVGEEAIRKMYQQYLAPKENAEAGS